MDPKEESGIYMVGDVIRLEEGKMVDVVLRVEGGGEKRNKNPWNSSESETEKSETEKSGSEESSVEEACRVALGSVLANSSEESSADGQEGKYFGETLLGRLSLAKREMGFAGYGVKGEWRRMKK